MKCKRVKYVKTFAIIGILQPLIFYILVVIFKD